MLDSLSHCEGQGRAQGLTVHRPRPVLALGREDAPSLLLSVPRAGLGTLAGSPGAGSRSLESRARCQLSTN